MDRHTLYGIGWRLADIVVVCMAGVIGMAWHGGSSYSFWNLTDAGWQWLCKSCC